MKREQLTKQIEAILLIENSHRSVESLATQLATKAETVTQCLQDLAEKYKDHGHGMEIAHSSRGVLLVPEEKIWEEIASHYRSRHEDPLPKPAVETLAIIAYSQPITTAEIERLRGLGAGYSIRLLLERELIMVTGTKKAPGAPRLYGTTAQFLQLYNLDSLKGLPALSEEDAVHFLSSR